MRILAVCGSLQRDSANAALLRAVAGAAAAPTTVVLHEPVDTLSHFSPGRDGGAPVERWRRAVADADAVVVATPEYAGGMPGVLKNALDWLVGSGELYGKPAVVVSAAPSIERGGNARASVALTLTMQGARVCDSFTVAIGRGASEEDLVAIGADVAGRIGAALDVGAGVSR